MELLSDGRPNAGRRAGGVCPKCGSGYAQRSHRRGWKERLGALIGLYPYRCWDCDHRFYLRFDLGFSHRGQAERLAARETETRWMAGREGPGVQARPWPTRLEIVFYAVVLLLLAGAVWYFVREAL
jgi:hypothetical protein